MMRYGWGYPLGGFGLFSWLPELLFWLFLVILIFSLFRRHSDHHCCMDNEEGGKAPLDYLKERYAKGEIDKKQFEEMKKDLNG